MGLLQDLRLAWRMMRREPGGYGIAVGSIGLSVGAAAIVFAAVQAVLLVPLPYSRAGELVQLRTEFPKMERQSAGDWVSWKDAREVGRRSRTLEEVGVYGNAMLDFAGNGEGPPEALYGLRVTANLFPLLGVAPVLGRNIRPEEDREGAGGVVLLSHGLWERRFGSDAGVVGRKVILSGRGYEVIGVMGADFNFPLRRGAARTPSPYVQFWAPMGSGHSGGLGAVARLRAWARLEDARAEVAGIGETLAREFPATNREKALRVYGLRERVLRGSETALWLLLGAAGLFVLLGCANVANLLLARGLAREREMAVRMALGAGHGRIVRQLLTESCFLAVLGAGIGYLFAVGAWRVLPAASPVSIPRLASAEADWRVLGFAMGVGILNGLLFGMAPAWRLARKGLLGVRSAGATESGRLRGLLVAGQVAAAVVLTMVGGQLLGSFWKLVDTDPGFAADSVLASVVLPAAERYPDGERRGLFFRRVLDAVRELPGVENAGTVNALPFSGENHGGTVSAAEGPGGTVAEINVAGGEYLQAMGVRLLEGRFFREEDMEAGGDAALVSGLIARRLWPGESAVGRRICVYCTPENPRNWKRVVGVVSEARHSALDEPETGGVYLAAGALEQAAFVVVRTGRGKAEMESAVRRAVAQIDPQQPVFLSATMEELVAESVADRRFVLLLLSATAWLALAIAAGGVYGVAAYAAARRRVEVGIRMAVGARPRQVVGLLFRQGMSGVVAGLTIGGAAGWAGMRLLGSAVPGLERSEVVWILGMAAVVLVAGAAACWGPAWRASRREPMEALQAE